MLDSCERSAGNTPVSLQGGGEAANAELFSEPNQTGRNHREKGKAAKGSKGLPKWPCRKPGGALAFHLHIDSSALK